MAHWYLSSCKLNCLNLYTHGKELLFLRYVICVRMLWNLLTALVIILKLLPFLNTKNELFVRIRRRNNCLHL